MRQKTLPSIADVKRRALPILVSHGVRRAGIFGSLARGETHSRSDVDLLIISRFKGKRRERIAELYGALIDSGFAQDIILMTPEEYEREREIPGTIARPASREGKVLYEYS
jgi:predicted nucleotidyltransferase